MLTDDEIAALRTQHTSHPAPSGEFRGWLYCNVCTWVDSDQAEQYEPWPCRVVRALDALAEARQYAQNAWDYADNLNRERGAELVRVYDQLAEARGDVMGLVELAVELADRVAKYKDGLAEWGSAIEKVAMDCIRFAEERDEALAEVERLRVAVEQLARLAGPGGAAVEAARIAQAALTGAGGE